MSSKVSIFAQNAKLPGAKLSRQSSKASLANSQTNSRRNSFSESVASGSSVAEKEEEDGSMALVVSSPSKTKRQQIRRFLISPSKRFTTRIKRAMVHYFIARCYEDEVKVRIALEEAESKDEEEEIQEEASAENNRLPKFPWMNVTYLKWRQAYHLYKAELYHEALEILKNYGLEEGRLLAKCDHGKFVHFMEHTSNVALTAARCCYKLFLVTKSHYYLEHAYEHYESVIAHFRVDMAMYLMLPPVLMEFGRLLEHYGAFPAATEIYNNIMRVFPTTREYFTVMYRCCIVGVYVAEIASDDVYKADLLNQCIDMLQFLLEALPESINDVHIVILYGKALEMSKDINVKFRAPGVFQSLYEICRTQELVGTKNFNNYKVWLASPATWLELANTLVAADEPLIARYCFEFHVQKVRNSLSIGTGLPAALGIETSLKIARNYASFQNFEDATKYAEIALQVNHFHKETRHCISLWSAIHKAMLEREEKSIAILSHNWKERTWTNKYRAKVKDRLVADLAEEYKEDHFNSEVRDKLAYFSTERWRSKFLYENDSAAKIQHWIREKRKIWRWQDVQRAKYLSLASQAYSLFRKMPFDYKVRKEIIRITDHKLCPRKHAINKVRDTVDRQNIAIDCMRQCWKCAILRWEIDRRVTSAEDRRKAFLGAKATRIQCAVRRHLARVNFSSRYAYLMKKHAAARVVQKYIRWRNSTFQHAVTRVIARAKRARVLAHNKMLMFFVPMMHLALFRFRRRRAKNIAEAKRQREIERKKQEAKTINGMVMMIQRFFRYRREVYHNHLFLRRYKLLTKRYWPETAFSTASWELLAELQNDPDAPYSSPGIRQNAPAFCAALQRVNIHCTEGFEYIDCMMLAGVLRHKQCRAQRLILQGVDARHSNFDFDLVAAIGKCKSLRSVHLLGVKVTEIFVKNLFKAIQEENPRCVEIHIEGIEYTANSRLKGFMAVSQKNINPNAAGLRVSMSAEGTSTKSPESGSPTWPKSSSATGNKSLRSPPLSKSISRSFSFRESGGSQMAKLSSGTQSPALRVPSLRTVYSSVLCASTGLLLSDYFNYAVPGITCVTLHKCSLRDADVELLVQGLQINTSLRKLVMSSNLLEDDGFCTIFKAVLCNTQNSALKILDFSGNLIRCKKEMRSLLDDFHHICAKGGYLEPDIDTDKVALTRGTASVPIAFAKQSLVVFLNDNMILKPYELPLHYITRTMLILHGVPQHQTDKYVAELTKRDQGKPKKALGTLLKTNKALLSSLQQRNTSGNMSLHHQSLSPVGKRIPTLEGTTGGGNVLMSQTAPLYMGKPLLSSTLPGINSTSAINGTITGTVSPPGRMLPGLSDFDLMHRSQSATVLQGQNGKDGGVYIG